MAPRATILHADLDAFYASVEQLLDPPCAGGRSPSAAASSSLRPTRRSGSAFRAAWPDGGRRSSVPSCTFVGGHFREYQRFGDRVMAVLGDFTPLVQRISIDEAFLDVCGLDPPLRSAGSIGEQIRRACETGDRPARSPSVRPAPNTSPRSPRKWPSPTAWWSSTPSANGSSSTPCPSGLIWGIGPVDASAVGRPRAFAPSASSPRPRRQALRPLLGGALGDEGERARRQQRPAAGRRPRASVRRSAPSRRSASGHRIPS